MHAQRIESPARRLILGRRAAILLLSGLPLLAPAMSVFAQDAVLAAVSQDQRFAAFVAEASRRFNIPETWIRAVMHAESEHVDDVSSAGAMGLMQIMPDTWTELRARYGLGADPFDPHDNILAGAAFLRELLDRYGNVGAMLAGYNAGPRRYDEYLTAGRPLPAETIVYVAKLAPIMGGNALPWSSETALTPQDWREAPLFVLPAGGAHAAAASQLDSHSAAAPTQQDVLSPQAPDGLFVATSRRTASP